MRRLFRRTPRFVGGRERTKSQPPPALGVHPDEPSNAAVYEELRAVFTAAVSHELRTPLARVLALLDWAALPGANMTDLLAQARAEVVQMSELVDDLLFLTELERGEQVVSLGATRALRVAQETADDYRARALSADIAVVVEGDPDVEVPLRPRMLRVVWENLVENAVLHAGRGARLRLAVERDSGVTLVAADDGIGVDEAELPRLFERFHRGDRARATRGTGLGLAIVKHVVAAGGGSVEARGGPGRGLEVRCSFPRSAADAE